MNAARWLLVMIVACADHAAAYTHVVHETNSGFIRLTWPNRSQPISFALNDRTSAALPNMLGESDPHGAVQRAIAAWPAVAAVRVDLGATSIASAGRDGTNVITFLNTPANAMQLEMAGDPIALTLYFFEDEDLVEADLLLNFDQRFSTTATSDDELDATNVADIEAVVVHELGHALGLNHSGVESATMWGFSSLGQRHLDADDVSGARALYGMGSSDRGIEGSRDGNSAADGAIAGAVQINGEPAFGAHVVAVSVDGPIISGLTLPNGHYRLDALEPGSYTLYVEPLDGPHGSAFIDGCVRFGDMGGGGIFDGAAFTIDFATTFYGGNDNPMMLTLEPDRIVLADFNLPAGRSELNPVRVGPANGDGSFARLAEFPLALAPGERQWVAIAGPGLDLVDINSIRVVGDGIRVDTSAARLPAVSCGGNPFPTIIFLVEVAADARPGGRAIFVGSGDDLAAFTGALDVQAPPPAGACVGDCNDDGVINVNELVRGVNISLDRASLDTCHDFDRNQDEQVSIDELVAAVNGLLIGC